MFGHFSTLCMKGLITNFFSSAIKNTVKNKIHRVHTPQISSKTTKHPKLNNTYNVELKIHTVTKNNPENTIA